MKTILIAVAICAVAVGAEARTVKSDTVNQYVIDNHKVANFDGSQLNGKTVAKYSIETTNSGKNVVKVHKITTSSAQASDAVVVGSGKMGDLDFSKAGDKPNSEEQIVVVGYGRQAKTPIGIVNLPGTEDLMLIVDGVEVSTDEFKNMSPNDIESMEVLKDSSAKKYTDKEGVGVILITTKAKGKSKK